MKRKDHLVMIKSHEGTQEIIVALSDAEADIIRFIAHELNAHQINAPCVWLDIRELPQTN